MLKRRANLPHGALLWLCLSGRRFLRRVDLIANHERIIALRLPEHLRKAIGLVQRVFFAVRIGDKQFAVGGNAAQNDIMPASGEIPRPHVFDNRPPLAQRIFDCPRIQRAPAAG